MSFFVEHKTYPYYVGYVRSLTSVPHTHTHLEMITARMGKSKPMWLSSQQP